MRAIGNTRPPAAGTTRSVSPSAWIDPDPPGSIEKKIQPSSPDQPSSTIGPGVSPGPILLYHWVSETTACDLRVRLLATQMVCFAVSPFPDDRTLAVQRPSRDTNTVRVSRPCVTRSRHVARSTTWTDPRRRKETEPSPGSGRQARVSAAAATATTNQLWRPPLRLSGGDDRGRAPRNRLGDRDKAGLYRG